MNVTISKEQAGLFLLEKQLLNETRRVGSAGITHLLETLRVVQYDPLNPCGRNADLVFQSRVKGYHINDYYPWVYEKRHGIEVYDKELCIIPIEDFSLTSHNRRKDLETPDIQAFLKTYAQELETLLNYIHEHGPVTSLDVQHQEKVSGFSWYGTRFGRIALEILWRTGRVVISKRLQGKKYYDIPEKVYSGDFFGSDLALEKTHILRRLSSVGILPLYGTGGGWQGLGNSGTIKELLASMLDNGELLEVQVSNVKQVYVIRSEDQELLQKKLKPSSEMKFIAPLDTVMWDRKMILNFFDFAYTWEVYVPLPKRIYGYYVLPVLYKGNFIGRIEPLLDKNNDLLIKGFWKEKDITWSKVIQHAFDQAIEEFKTYLQADKVILQFDTNLLLVT